MSKQNDNLIGKTLGQFVIQEEIGRGGMASVYSARQTSMNRIVAVKILPQHFMHDPGFLERFEREVAVISQLEHPHILPIYDYGEVDGIPYIAMRYLGGGSMAQMVRRGVSEVADIEKPLTQIAQALDYAHQQGVIHRDLKPGNIMLDDNGNAYLSDFGIARVMGSDLTGSAIIGTPAYMSPEQAHGVSIDGRSDIYSLGIVLFELLTGREPFQSETPMGLLLMHINEPIPPVSEFRTDIPPAIERVIQKATSKNPDDRYASATELATAYSNALRGAHTEQTSKKPTVKHEPDATLIDAPAPPSAGDTLLPSTGQMTPRPATSPGTQIPPAPTPSPVPEPATKSRGWLYGLIGLLVIAIGGGALWVGLSLSGVQAMALPTPTPFDAAIRIVQDEYSISMPRALVPSRDDFRDLSDPDRLYHRWEGANDQTYVTLAIVSSSRVSVTQYDSRYYGDSDALTVIDEVTAPDGTLRRSYRVRSTDASASAGQLDVFYIPRGDALAIVEMFTADTVANNDDLLQELQLILDSLVIRMENPA